MNSLLYRFQLEETFNKYWIDRRMCCRHFSHFNSHHWCCHLQTSETEKGNKIHAGADRTGSYVINVPLTEFCA